MGDLRIIKYIWSIRIEGIQFQQRVSFNPSTGYVGVYCTWMKSVWFKHKDTIKEIS